MGTSKLSGMACEMLGWGGGGGNLVTDWYPI